VPINAPSPFAVTILQRVHLSVQKAAGTPFEGNGYNRSDVVTGLQNNASEETIRAGYAVLVRDAATGDRRAMERLLMRAQEVAYRFSLLVCGHPEDAEDVMQDALLKTYQHVTRIEKPEAFRTWLYSTIRNACLIKRRRRVGEPAQFVSLDQQDAGTDGTKPAIDIADRARPADQRLIDDSNSGRLRRALQSLPAAYRMIVVMREMEGLSTKEVATITEMSEANVKTRLRRARVMLRQRLEGA
jgi:RNA polymerase sigma-70 factor (ECF subfamily)